MTDTDRAEYIEGLRHIAGMLTDHPDIPLPFHGTTLPLAFHIRVGDGAATLHALTDQLTGKAVEAGITGTYDLAVAGRIRGVDVKVHTNKALVPQTVTGTRTVDQVDYDYTGLLAERAS
jgi:hypothetical protein